MEKSENVMNEIVNAAERLGMSADDAVTKFDSIMEKTGVDPTSNEPLAVNLWRQYYANAMAMKKRNEATNASGGEGETGGSNSFYKTARGFFVTSETPFDLQESNRKKAVAAYERDSSDAYNDGIVAIAVADGDSYEIKQTYRGEEVTKVLPSLPANHVEVSEGTYVIPLDTADYDWNKAKFGKPLPKEGWQWQGVFIGEVDGNMGKYFFSYRKPASKDFTPRAFEWLTFSCTLNSNNPAKIHGATSRTLDSLEYSEEVGESIGESMQDLLMEYSEDNYSPLVDLETAHNNMDEKDWGDKFVFTDGTVSNILMNVSETTGNRVILLDDLTMFGAGEFNYDEDQPTTVTCWTPERFGIDFGIGSSIVLVGRTSQGTDSETGELRPVSLNVTGILVTDRNGNVPEPIVGVEEEDDWILGDVDFAEED